MLPCLTFFRKLSLPRQNSSPQFFLFFNIFYCGFFAHLREMKRPKYFRNWFLIYARVVKAHVKGNTNRKITILCVKMFETTSEPMRQLRGRCIAIILWMVNPPKQVGCMIKYPVFFGWMNYVHLSHDIWTLSVAEKLFFYVFLLLISRKHSIKNVEK